jgi:transglutaminase-like putative cysteine protease/FtsH-binding integral membrane protein
MQSHFSSSARDQRLPWTATGAALVAFAALTAMGGPSPVLPLLAAGLLATYFFAARIEPQAWWVHWLLRLLLYSAVIFVNANKGNENLVDSFLSGPAMDALGQVMAAEVVIQAWRRQPTQPPMAITLILLSGIIIAAACQTMNTQWPRLFVPLYLFLLLLSLSRPRAANQAKRIIAAAAAVLAGMCIYSNIWAYRAALMRLGSIYLDGERHIPATAGLSTESDLEDTFGLNESPSRVLQITGMDRITYLRAVSFDTYLNGRWGPPAPQRQIHAASFQPLLPGKEAIVTALATTDNMIFAPLNCAGINFLSNGTAQWSSQFGGPITIAAAQPAPYLIIQSEDPDFQGPLAPPPSPVEIRRCLALPVSIDPRIAALAQSITAQAHTPQERIDAITDYLMSHHQYSLTFQPGPGDPIAAFLFQTPPATAHCEFFASSAALLLRCVGVPARYVIGYYAHEQDRPDVTVVRQWDAHAWTEAWVPRIGWETVDATPGDGRPHEDLANVPFWQRLTEWLTNEISILRSNVLYWGKEWGGDVLVSLLLLGIILGIILRLIRQRKTVSSAPPHTYTVSSAELADLSDQFEALLTRWGYPCPAETPWEEHLTDRGLSDPALVQFVHLYNQARFGGSALLTYDELAKMMDRLAQPTQAGSAEKEPLLK